METPNNSVHPSSHSQGEKEKGHHEVTITVNGEPVKVHKGYLTVAEIKELGCIPPGYELDEVVVKSEFLPLNDDARVPIKGGEMFVGHKKDSASS